MKKGNCRPPPLKIMHGGMADLQLPTQNYGDLLNGVWILASNCFRFGGGNGCAGDKRRALKAETRIFRVLFGCEPPRVISV